MRLPWRHTLHIGSGFSSIQARPPGLCELIFVSDAEKLRGGVIVPQWTVVTARSPVGTLDLVVPTADVPLVSAWLNGGSGMG